MEDETQQKILLSSDTVFTMERGQAPHGEAPDAGQGQQGGQPPEMPAEQDESGQGSGRPEGGAPQGEQQNPPEKPEGGQQPGEMTMDYTMLKEGDEVTVTVAEDGVAQTVAVSLGEPGAGGAPGGVHVAGGGTLYAWDLQVETAGESSAAIRSDRGSGKMVVDGGSYLSTGVGSPVIYSTADIAVHGASLTAEGSEAICIEGLNSIRLFDCDLSGNMQDWSQNDCTWNVILYQSLSGDSQVGNSTFEMQGGSLTAKNGGMF